MSFMSPPPALTRFQRRSSSAALCATGCSANLGCPNFRSAVTAVYKGTPKDGRPVLLRSYDSRREPPIEFDCKVWEAGRATCAVGLAFKPIQIGQSVFHDDGAGTFNPSPEALDEAVVNEWPGRDVGVFLSIGTGRRPKSHDNNQHLWYEGLLPGFAEARQRLISKIENCETIHEYMVYEHLSKRNVPIENYYRLNVEMGVGEFGMNEWHRLSDISTNTRRYLMKEQEQRMVEGVSTKLAKIARAWKRLERFLQTQQLAPDAAMPKDMDLVSPLAVELAGDVPLDWPQPNAISERQSYDSGPDNLLVAQQRTPSPPIVNSARVSSSSHATIPSSPTSLHRTSPYQHNHRLSAPPSHGAVQHSLPTSMAQDHQSSHRPDIFVVAAPSPSQYNTAIGVNKVTITDAGDMPRQSSLPPAYRIDPPPPIPPKTPLPENQLRQSARRLDGVSMMPPYPIEEDEPPPTVNMARKPDYRRR